MTPKQQMIADIAVILDSYNKHQSVNPGVAVHLAKLSQVMLEENDQLRSTLCENPEATMCAKLWESDHQRKCLKRHGLDGEFPFGCDAIDEVASELVRLRKDNDQLRADLEHCYDLAACPDSCAAYVLKNQELREENAALKERLEESQ